MSRSASLLILASLSIALNSCCATRSNQRSEIRDQRSEKPKDSDFIRALETLHPILSLSTNPVRSEDRIFWLKFHLPI
jgi:hypothetical protein